MVADNGNEPDPGFMISSVRGAEQRDMERKLYESEERYRVMFELAGVGIAHVGIDGHWLQVNQKLCDIVGYTREELLERTFQDITYPEDLEATFEHMRRLLQNELQSCTLEKRYLRKDGELIWVNLTISLVSNPQYFVSVIEDISERKRVQARERERETALYEANQRMEEFLGTASHELRTPLTTIKANIQLAMRRLKTLSGRTSFDLEEVNGKVSAAQDMLIRAERQVGVLNRLVGDMIDISRIQSGKLQVHLLPEPCNLVTIVQEIVQEQRKAVPGHSILLEIAAEKEIPVLADPDRIGQVLTNYIGNALKYSEVECPITVYLEREEQSVRVSIRDEGPGLSPEEQKHIWECFYQAPGVRVVSGSGVGLGLGLYISQTIIERHSGQVGVQSVQGKGSTFWFTLPIVQQNGGE
jgi:PAS domain S-box-containing protein